MSRVESGCHWKSTRPDCAAQVLVVRDELEPLVEHLIAGLPSDVWLERRAGAGLPSRRVRTIEEMMSHPQLLARQRFVEAASPVGTLPVVRFPAAGAEHERRVPGLGQETDEILGAAGYRSDEIAALRSAGVVA